MTGAGSVTGTVAVPARMRAGVWSAPGRPPTVETVPTPLPEGPDDVLVGVRAAMFGAALVRAVTAAHPKLSPPAVLGTLVAGEVVATGAAVIGVRPGQAITFDPHPPCGECAECVDGLPELCAARHRVQPGAHAEYVRIRPPLTRHIAPIPPGVSFPAAMLTEIVACVLDATELAGIGPGQDVLVLGCGPVALIQLQLARAHGARRVLCSVKHPARAALVRWFGGEPVPAGPDLDARVAELTGGRGPHVVVEAVGSGDTYRTALRTVRTGGTVVGFGGCPKGTEIAVDPNDIHYRRIRFLGSYHYRPGYFHRAVDLLADGTVDVEPMITHRIPLDRIADAVRIARSPECIVPVIEP